MFTPEQIYKNIQDLSLIVSKIGKREKQAVAQLGNVYKSVYGHSIKFGCKNCVTKAYIKLANLSLNNIIEMKSSKFQMKPGIRIQYPAFGPNYYTTENMTDAVAEKYLKAHPEGVRFFKDYPKDEDGNLLLEEKAPKAEKEPKAPKEPKEPKEQKQPKGDKAPKGEKAPKAEKEPVQETQENTENMIDHVVTQEDLDNNPELAAAGVSVGETIKVPAE